MEKGVFRFPLEEEYKKPTGITPEDISRLRQWICTQPHLPHEQITDLELILAYHCCNRSSELSKQLLDLHYTLKGLFTQIFANRVYNDRTESVLNTFLLTPLPTRTKEGYAAFYTNILDTDPKNFHFCDTLKTILMIIDLWQIEEGTWPGLVMIFDLAGFKLGHISKLEIQIVQQFLYYLQEAMLLKVKGLHFLNAPSVMDRLMMIIKPFMKKELFEVVRIHQVGSDTLDEYFPMSGLPKDVGGEYKTLQECKDELIKKLWANKQFFEEEDKKRLTESLRPGKPKTITDIFGGIEGSFKKLDID